MFDLPRLFLVSSLLIVSGLFSEEENACRKDYVFCPNCSIGSNTATPTPDGDTTTTTPTGSATATPTDDGTGDTPEPTETSDGTTTPDSTVGAAGNLFFEIAKELNKGSVTPVPPASLPTPAPVVAKDLGNWIGAIGDDQQSLVDSDGDGFLDDLEVRLGTDPENANSAPRQGTTNINSRVAGKDSDYDGESDQDEIANRSDPLNRDTDHDGCIDGLEIEAGTLPNDANDRIETSIDRDGDCLIDTIEAKKTTNPNNSDTDQDGLLDGDEIAIGTDPFGKDTEGDGILDGTEVKIGSDPMIPDFRQ